LNGNKQGELLIIEVLGMWVGFMWFMLGWQFKPKNGQEKCFRRDMALIGLKRREE
jgi:hypothetical protein